MDTILEQLREIVLTMLMSMVPLIELRGGLPFGVSLGLSYSLAAAASIVGNMIPVPFIILFIRRVFAWMRRKNGKFDVIVTKYETKAEEKGQLVKKYSLIGLYILVAIPLPGTGAWTGALVAAMMELEGYRSTAVIFAGVCTAALIMAAITFGISSVII